VDTATAVTVVYDLRADFC